MSDFDMRVAVLELVRRYGLDAVALALDNIAKGGAVLSDEDLRRLYETNGPVRAIKAVYQSRLVSLRQAKEIVMDLAAQNGWQMPV